MKIEIGDKVRFTYIKNVEKGLVNGVLVSDYAKNSERYSGEVVEIRDIENHGLSNETLRYGNIKGDRSKLLITIEDEPERNDINFADSISEEPLNEISNIVEYWR